jgi:hypothetical protein
MPAPLKLSIDVTKIDKTALYKGAKGTYLTLILNFKEEEDQYGNICSLKQDLGIERREEPANYLGNGKYLMKKAGNRPTPTPKPTPAVEDDDIPF